MFVLCYNLIHCLVVLDRLQISVKGPYDSHDVTGVFRCFAVYALDLREAAPILVKYAAVSDA